MKYKGRERSRNVEDRRGGPSKGLTIGAGTIIIVVLALLMGENPLQFLQQNGGGMQGEEAYVSTEKEE
jgi:predicted metalloprotease